MKNIAVVALLFAAFTLTAQTPMELAPNKLKRTAAREGTKGMAVRVQINNLAADLKIYAAERAIAENTESLKVKDAVTGQPVTARRVWMETRIGFHLGQYERRCNEVMAMLQSRTDLNPRTIAITNACLERPKDSTTLLSLVDKLNGLSQSLAVTK